MLAYCSKSDLSGGGRACSLSVVALCALCKQSKCGLWAEEVPSGTALCARGTGWFHKDFESSQEGCRKSQSSFSSCHDFFFLNPFVCAGTTDCVMSWITLTVFLLDQSLIQCFLCIKWGRRDPEGQKRNCGKTCVCWYPSSSTVSQLL